ncbi:MAG: UDP-glucose 4-epimerase GalE [Myxococcota bacterium]
MSKTILVTGGAGYIGSHTCLLLLEAGHEVIVVDSLVNASAESLRRVESIAGRSLDFHELDLLDAARLEQLLTSRRPDKIIHFAALKAVGESMSDPLRYYHNNLAGTLSLMRAMEAAKVHRVVFSSSATVYGEPARVPVGEDADLRPTNPYGQTKAMIERMLLDQARAAPWGVVLLRYFNPVGAHPSGRIGEDPAYPNNLLPFVTQVAAGQREKVVIFGNDYPTPDGTGVRDYIHVMDLARAHLAALRRLDDGPGAHAYNVGTGRGYSVQEVIEAARRASGRSIPTEVGPRRAGDIAELTADPGLAQAELGWRAEHDLDDMVASAWHWQSENPKGYRS